MDKSVRRAESGPGLSCFLGASNAVGFFFSTVVRLSASSLFALGRSHVRVFFIVSAFLYFVYSPCCTCSPTWQKLLLDILIGRHGFPEYVSCLSYMDLC